MIEKIKQWFFYRHLRGISKPKNTITQGLNLGTRMSILFDGNDQTDCQEVLLLKKKLTDCAARQVSVLAFIDNEESTDTLDYKVFNNKNLTWYGAPFGVQVEEFINEKCDILLVLCHKKLPQFEYIVALSAASFIIGTDISMSKEYFDLIIESDSGMCTSDLIQKILDITEKLAFKP